MTTPLLQSQDESEDKEEDLLLPRMAVQRTSQSQNMSSLTQKEKELGSSVKKALPTAANSTVNTTINATSPGVPPSNLSGSNSQVQTSSAIVKSTSAVQSTSAKPNIQGKA